MTAAKSSAGAEDETAPASQLHPRAGGVTGGGPPVDADAAPIDDDGAAPASAIALRTIGALMRRVLVSISANVTTSFSVTAPGGATRSTTRSVTAPTLPRRSC